MTPIFWVLVAVVGSVVVMSSIIAWCRVHATDLASAYGYMEHSYKHAQKLVRAPSTPENVLDFVQFFVGAAGTPRLARVVGLSLLMEHLGILRRTGRSPITETVETLSPEAQKNFAVMITSGMLASAAADPLFSRLYLHLLRPIFDGAAERSGDKVEVASNPPLDRATAFADELTRFGLPQQPAY